MISKKLKGVKMVQQSNGNFINFSKTNGIDKYKSVNTFSGYRRRSDDKFELMNFYLDLDFKDLGISQEEYSKDGFEFVMLDKVIERCKELKLSVPTKVNFSGNGLHIFWSIKNINEKNEEGKKLFGANARECDKVYTLIQEELINNFNDLGSDVNCKDISRVLRIENTINSKNNKECKRIFTSDSEVTISEFAKLLKYDLEEVRRFKNQKSTTKQIEIAKELEIEISDNKFIAQQQIKEKLKQINNHVNDNYNQSYLKGIKNNKDYVLNFLDNAYKLGYIKRGKGITNNYFYLLGIASKRSGDTTLRLFNKYIKLIEHTRSEVNEFRTSFLSGVDSNNYYLNVSYKKLAKLLKVDNVEKVKSYKPTKKRSKKEYVIKVFNRLKANKKDLSLSSRKLSRKYNLSNKKMLELKNTIIQLLKEEERVKLYNNQNKQEEPLVIDVKNGVYKIVDCSKVSTTSG